MHNIDGALSERWMKRGEDDQLLSSAYFCKRLIMHLMISILLREELLLAGIQCNFFPWYFLLLVLVTLPPPPATYPTHPHF
jgi:hypothetical protein